MTELPPQKVYLVHLIFFFSYFLQETGPVIPHKLFPEEKFVSPTPKSICPPPCRWRGDIIFCRYMLLFLFHTKSRISSLTALATRIEESPIMQQIFKIDTFCFYLTIRKETPGGMLVIHRKKTKNLL